MLSNSSNKFIGYKVLFNIGRYQTILYMAKDEYEVWKLERDSRISEVVVQDVEVPMSYFLGEKE